MRLPACANAGMAMRNDLHHARPPPSHAAKAAHLTREAKETPELVLG